jgi:uncharacterized integral membrane protein (TIGR00698 family)
MNVGIAVSKGVLPVSVVPEDVRHGLAPGFLLATAVAVVSTLLATAPAGFAPLPAMVIALFVGMAINPIARRPEFAPGMAFCVKTVLRCAVALLGLRIAIGEIAALGSTTVFIVVLAMAITVVSGCLVARVLGQSGYSGALAGVASAVCGASATLATATSLPAYPGKEADIAFVVIAVNALSTLAMLLYPPLCAALGLSWQSTGIMLGATIHDVAQVVGAGYGVSDGVGNTAVVVKLFRVFLLLPVVLVIGYWFARVAASGRAVGNAPAAKVPMPVFAFAFLALCLVNSVAPSVPALAPGYAWAKDWLTDFSTWGLLIAIGALGLGTSLGALKRLGWRHAATVSAATLAMASVVTTGLLIVEA